MKPAFNRGTTAPSKNGTFQLATGKFARFLNGQWRMPHADITRASSEMRIDGFPSPQFRIAAHHWWTDELASTPVAQDAAGVPGDDDQKALADAAFSGYDFGDGVTVTDTSGWEYTAPGHERSCKVYVETPGEDDGPAPRWILNFTVRFDPQTGLVADAYALDTKGEIWGCMPVDTSDPVKVVNQDVIPCKPSQTLKHAVLERVYEDRFIERLDGFEFLVAKHLKTNVGIFVVDGNFGRPIFKRAVAEAKQAGLNSARMYVYGQTATYSGPAICFSQFAEIGINLEQACAPAKG